MKAILLLCLWAASALSFAATPAQQAHPEWRGAEVCRSCHQEAYEAWRGSHHDLAMQHANADTVLGNFSDQRFEYAGKSTQFYRKGEEYWVKTEGPDGKQTDYQIAYVFGFHPLQQYLIAFPGGRLQALSVAWDSRTEAQGGQRWYHLYPDEAVVAGDPLHWTGPYQNWNLQCAECHSTRLEKNYDLASDSYGTTWTEINVSCEACHGPGAEHVTLAQSGRLAEAAAAGFPASLAERGYWAWAEGSANAARQEALPASQQVETCGRCHARRGVLGDYHFGGALSETHRPALLRDPLYHPDGQILDEVYVYGSFRQSKMYQAGVVCSNCHDPHRGSLRAPGNGVCAQCHQPAVYETPEHHHHSPGEPGSACVDCHMPEQTYMVVDPRRDHSMRIPRPDLSAALGTPNACNQCHSERDATWAVQQLRRWDIYFNDTSSHPARSIALAREGDDRAVPGLLALANNEAAPGIWRATAMLELASFPNQQGFQAAVLMLDSEDPMLRRAAARSMLLLPLPQRYQQLAPLISDPDTTVRLEVARLLSEIPPEHLDADAGAALQGLFAEYLEIMLRNADTPEGQLELGMHYMSQQQMDAAENAFLKAIELNPQLVVAYLNTADFYRLTGRDRDGRKLLQTATQIAPEEGTLWHALGLLEIRQGNNDKAIGYLEKGAELETAGIRHRFVYAVALHDRGDAEAAIAALQQLLREAPDHQELLFTLANYNRELGRREEAQRYGRRLLELMPDNPRVRQFYETL